jgi:hypothetical protein
MDCPTSRFSGSEAAERRVGQTTECDRWAPEVTSTRIPLGARRRSAVSLGATGVIVGFVLLAAPLATTAQQPGKVFRIGILSNVPLTDPQGAPLWGAFTEGLRELGYVDGRNTTIVHRSSEGKYERLPGLAAELVRLKVDVIVVPAPQNAVAARQATQTIPIVMASAGDPVESGLVDNLARPGGNLTGTAGLVGPEIVGKNGLSCSRRLFPESPVLLFSGIRPIGPLPPTWETRRQRHGRWGCSSKCWRRTGPRSWRGYLRE